MDTRAALGCGQVHMCRYLMLWVFGAFIAMTIPGSSGIPVRRKILPTPRWPPRFASYRLATQKVLRPWIHNEDLLMDGPSGDGPTDAWESSFLSIKTSLAHSTTDEYSTRSPSPEDLYPTQSDPFPTVIDTAVDPSESFIDELLSRKSGQFEGPSSLLNTLIFRPSVEGESSPFISPTPTLQSTSTVAQLTNDLAASWTEMNKLDSSWSSRLALSDNPSDLYAIITAISATHIYGEDTWALSVDPSAGVPMDSVASINSNQRNPEQEKSTEDYLPSFTSTTSVHLISTYPLDESYFDTFSTNWFYSGDPNAISGTGTLFDAFSQPKDSNAGSNLPDVPTVGTATMYFGNNTLNSDFLLLNGSGAFVPERSSYHTFLFSNVETTVTIIDNKDTPFTYVIPTFTVSGISYSDRTSFHGDDIYPYTATQSTDKMFRSEEFANDNQTETSEMEYDYESEVYAKGRIVGQFTFNSAPKPIVRISTSQSKDILTPDNEILPSIVSSNTLGGYNMSSYMQSTEFLSNEIIYKTHGSEIQRSTTIFPKTNHVDSTANRNFRSLVRKDKSFVDSKIEIFDPNTHHITVRSLKDSSNFDVTEDDSLGDATTNEFDAKSILISTLGLFQDTFISSPQTEHLFMSHTVEFFSSFAAISYIPEHTSQFSTFHPSFTSDIITETPVNGLLEFNNDTDANFSEVSMSFVHLPSDEFVKTSKIETKVFIHHDATDSSKSYEHDIEQSIQRPLATTDSNSAKNDFNQTLTPNPNFTSVIETFLTSDGITSTKYFEATKSLQSEIAQPEKSFEQDIKHSSELSEMAISRSYPITATVTPVSVYGAYSYSFSSLDDDILDSSNISKILENKSLVGMSSLDGNTRETGEIMESDESTLVNADSFRSKLDRQTHDYEVTPAFSQKNHSSQIFSQEISRPVTKILGKSYFEFQDSTKVLEYETEHATPKEADLSYFYSSFIDFSFSTDLLTSNFSVLSTPSPNFYQTPILSTIELLSQIKTKDALVLASTLVIPQSVDNSDSKTKRTSLLISSSNRVGKSSRSTLTSVTSIFDHLTNQSINPSFVEASIVSAEIDSSFQQIEVLDLNAEKTPFPDECILTSSWCSKSVDSYDSTEIKEPRSIDFGNIMTTSYSDYLTPSYSTTVDMDHHELVFSPSVFSNDERYLTRISNDFESKVKHSSSNEFESKFSIPFTTPSFSKYASLIIEKLSETSFVSKDPDSLETYHTEIVSSDMFLSPTLTPKSLDTKRAQELKSSSFASFVGKEPLSIESDHPKIPHSSSSVSSIILPSSTTTETTGQMLDTSFSITSVTKEPASIESNIELIHSSSFLAPPLLSSHSDTFLGSQKENITKEPQSIESDAPKLKHSSSVVTPMLPSYATLMTMKIQHETPTFIFSQRKDPKSIQSDQSQISTYSTKPEITIFETLLATKFLPHIDSKLKDPKSIESDAPKPIDPKSIESDVLKPKDPKSIESEVLKPKDPKSIESDVLKPKDPKSIESDVLKPKDPKSIESEVLKPKDPKSIESDVLKPKDPKSIQSDVLKPKDPKSIASDSSKPVLTSFHRPVLGSYTDFMSAKPQFEHSPFFTDVPEFKPTKTTKVNIFPPVSIRPELSPTWVGEENTTPEDSEDTVVVSVLAISSFLNMNETKNASVSRSIGVTSKTDESPTNIDQVVPTKNPLLFKDNHYWILTVLEAPLKGELPENFSHTMEIRLANAYSEAFRFRAAKSEDIKEGKDLVIVKILSLTDDILLRQLEMVYVVEKGGALVPASVASEYLSSLRFEQLREFLGHHAIVKARPYRPANDNSRPVDSPLPVLSIVGGVLGGLLLIFCCFCVYCRCCKSKHVPSSPESSTSGSLQRSLSKYGQHNRKHLFREMTHHLTSEMAAQMKHGSTAPDIYLAEKSASAGRSLPTLPRDEKSMKILKILENKDASTSPIPGKLPKGTNEAQESSGTSASEKKKPPKPKKRRRIKDSHEQSSKSLITDPICPPPSVPIPESPPPTPPPKMDVSIPTLEKRRSSDSGTSSRHPYSQPSSSSEKGTEETESEGSNVELLPPLKDLINKSKSESDAAAAETEKHLSRVRQRISELLDDAFALAGGRRLYGSLRSKKIEPAMEILPRFGSFRSQSAAGGQYAFTKHQGGIYLERRPISEGGQRLLGVITDEGQLITHPTPKLVWEQDEMHSTLDVERPLGEVIEACNQNLSFIPFHPQRIREIPSLPSSSSLPVLDTLPESHHDTTSVSTVSVLREAASEVYLPHSTRIHPAAIDQYDEIDVVSALRNGEPVEALIQAIKDELQKFSSSLPGANDSESHA